MRKGSAAFFAVLLLLLSGCRAGSETGGYTESAEASSPPIETLLTEEAEITTENEDTGEGNSTEETVRKLPRVRGEEVFGLVFSMRDGDERTKNFTLTNAEGQIAQVINGMPCGEIDIGVGFIIGSPGLLNCSVPYTDSFILDTDYTQEDNTMTTWLSYWYYGTDPNISGSNIRQIAVSKDELRVQGDNMQDYQVDVRNLEAEVSYEELPSLRITGTDESEVWLTGLKEKNQVQIHTEASGYTVQIVRNEGPGQVILEESFQPGQVAVVNYNPGEFSIHLLEP